MAINACLDSQCPNSALLQPQFAVYRHVLQVELSLHGRLAEHGRELDLLVVNREDEIAREQKPGFDHSFADVDYILRRDRMILAVDGECGHTQEDLPGVGVAE